MHFKTLLLLTVACSQHVFAAAAGGAVAEIHSDAVSDRANTSRSIPYVCSREEDLALMEMETCIHRMDQWGINWALKTAAESGHQALVEVLLNRPEGQVHPVQDGINNALAWAARRGHQTIVEFLLSRPEGQLRPDQRGINSALIFSAYEGHQVLVEMLVNRLEGQLRPDQKAINGALERAIRMLHTNIITTLIANGASYDYDDTFFKIYLRNPAVLKAIEEGRAEKRKTDAWRRRHVAVAAWHYRNGFYTLTDSSVTDSSAVGGAAAAGGAGVPSEPVD